MVWWIWNHKNLQFSKHANFSISGVFWRFGWRFLLTKFNKITLEWFWNHKIVFFVSFGHMKFRQPLAILWLFFQIRGRVQNTWTNEGEGVVIIAVVTRVAWNVNKFCVYALSIPLFMLSNIADTVNKHTMTMAD